MTGQNYLRGVQESDAEGKVSFTSIFPGCYSGRWPHMHLEIYPSLASATSSANKLATTQLALPEAACREAYEGAGYAASHANLDGTSLASDNVFRDGYDAELALVEGSVSSAYTARLLFGVAR